ncbi:MAG: signal peptidase II [Anaerolineales bacterium]|nr:signal peptidase II [Anaerolineales bacterium]MCA9931174.1 signal peptidase II [Anaerolineales bacterium]
MPYFTILLIFLADRLSKRWAAAYFATHGPIEINALFTLRQTYNEGVAFGMFQGIGPLIGWLTILVVIWLFVYLVRAPKQAWLLRYGLGILIGGALGNMIDRILVGQVLDFIESPLRSGIFNVADISINLGMVLVLAGSFIHRNVLNESEETAVSENNEL